MCPKCLYLISTEGSIFVQNMLYISLFHDSIIINFTFKGATFDKACGHLKAVAYFVESARDNCKLRACECTWKKFLASKCSRDKCVYWGFDSTEDSAGTYYGVTATAFPYCRTDGSE